MASIKTMNKDFDIDRIFKTNNEDVDIRRNKDFNVVRTKKRISKLEQEWK